jgi:LacI family transcriptional regulator, repressor for deo operon, udp, cdd, tsx, nupC, and nupG
MSTMIEVAQLANVSVATVSRVLWNTDPVKPATRDRVLNAIKALNYQPNILARQLRRKETNSILVVVPDITNSFFSKVLLGIETVAHKFGYQVLLGDTQNDVKRELQYVDLLRQKRADGMILLTARMKHIYIEEIAEQYPVVLACEYLEGSTVPTVSIDNISSAKKLTDHLIALGHRRIAFISGPLEVIVSRDRLKGFKQSFTQHELEIDPLLIHEGDFSLESGFNLVRKLVALENKPTAVFASNDEMAIGAIKGAKSLGLHVPTDIAVVGFDDIKMAAICEPELTTIAQPAFRIGKDAMELLIQLMNQEPITKRYHVLEDQLIVRSSCGMKMVQSKQLPHIV